MKFRAKTIRELAEMITGGSGGGMFGGGTPSSKYPEFPYRSSSSLTEFFINADTDKRHDGSTRVAWVESTLNDLSAGQTSSPGFPSDAMVRVIQELMDGSNFRDGGRDRQKALADLNVTLAREGFQAFLDGHGMCHLRNTGTKVTSEGFKAEPVWTEEEKKKLAELERYLDSASEDDFTEHILLPILGRRGFSRISPAGHKDKALEFGKDIWMKYRLPTTHFIYFGVQVKKQKIDASGKGGDSNISEVLTQVRMALDHPIFDPEINQRVLLDHVYIVSAGEITKQAKQLLGEKLDQENRRHILFMDRKDILTLAVSSDVGPPGGSEAGSDDELPF